MFTEFIDDLLDDVTNMRDRVLEWNREIYAENISQKDLVKLELEIKKMINGLNQIDQSGCNIIYILNHKE